MFLQLSYISAYIPHSEGFFLKRKYIDVNILVLGFLINGLQTDNLGFDSFFQSFLHVEMS